MIYDKRINSGNLNSNARFDCRQHKAVALLAVRGAGEGGTAVEGKARGREGDPRYPHPRPPGARPAVPAACRHRPRTGCGAV